MWMLCCCKRTHHISLSSSKHLAWYPVLPFQPKYRLGHPKNHYFHYLKKYFLDQSIQKNILFNFEKGSTDDISGVSKHGSTAGQQTISRRTSDSRKKNGCINSRYIERLRCMYALFVTAQTVLTGHTWARGLGNGSDAPTLDSCSFTTPTHFSPANCMLFHDVSLKCLTDPQILVTVGLCEKLRSKTGGMNLLIYWLSCTHWPLPYWT